jgi:hypothetical protein
VRKLLIVVAALLIALVVAFFILTDESNAPENPIGAPSAQSTPVAQLKLPVITRSLSA